MGGWFYFELAIGFVHMLIFCTRDNGAHFSEGWSFPGSEGADQLHLFCNETEARGMVWTQSEESSVFQSTNIHKCLGLSV